MSLKILVDMNLSPEWCEAFAAVGWESVHWSAIGEPTADDRTIMQWAVERGYLVFTHDLDFSAILAATQASGPSVIQLRVQNILPDALAETVIGAMRQYEEQLLNGSLIVIEHSRQRIRILPLR
jgi:predicted nuclease of predicted toxin-antitoxin system